MDESAAELVAKGLLFVFPALGDVPVRPIARGAANSSWLQVSAAISSLKGLHMDERTHHHILLHQAVQW